MRSTMALILSCFIFVTTGHAQDKGGRNDRVKELINALASVNPVPTKRSGPDLKYPANYDREKQELVRDAKRELKALGPTAFESLVESWDDNRYCLTYSIGINGYMYNATVGRICKVIMFDQIQPFGIWPRTDDDPRGKPKRPSYPSVYLADAKAAKRWLEEHKDKSLYEIQLMVVDWVIERESESPNDFTDKERDYMKEVREKLLDAKKPIAKGNYYMDDYD